MFAKICIASIGILTLTACAHSGGAQMASQSATSRSWSMPLSSGARAMAAGQCNAIHQVVRIEKVEAAAGTMIVTCAPEE